MYNQKLEVLVNKDNGFVKAPFPNHFGLTLDILSGRKFYNNDGVRFESTPNNLDQIKLNHPEVLFLDDDGTLEKLSELRGLLTQHGEHPDLTTDYKPKMDYLPVQLKTLKQSARRNVFAHLHAPDNGKTAIMIHESGILWMDKKITGTLIVAPNNVDGQWTGEEIPKHIDPSLKYTCENWDKSKKTVYDFNRYKTHLEFFSLNIDSFSRGTKGGDAVKAFIRAHKGRVNFILDESHDIRNQSKRTKLLVALANDEKGCVGFTPHYKRIATGTLIGKSLLDAYTQFLFLDRRILGHKFITSYKNEYCILGGYEGREVVGSKNTERFYGKIAPHCFRISKEEKGRAMPTIIKHYYKMDEKTKKVYKPLKDTFITQIDSGEITTVKTGLTCQMRLQQITSGHVAIDQPMVKGAKRKPKPITKPVSNQRVKFCFDIIKKIKGPVIIWVRFAPDMVALQQFLLKKKRTVEIYKGTKKKKDDIKARFLNSEIDVMIANPASGGVGLNLQGSCTEDIYFSYSHNSIHHWQSLERIDRRGSNGEIKHHIIICKNSVDVGIMRSLDKKEKVSKRSLDGVRMNIAGEEPEKKKEPKVEKVSKELESLLF
jgi:SNF2 family DNA or RNA helicase